MKVIKKKFCLIKCINFKLKVPGYQKNVEGSS